MDASRTHRLRTLWPWQVARWSRVAPGRVGLVALALYPALFFAPLTRIPLFTTWSEGASALLLLGVLGAAFAVMRDVGAAHAAEFWMFQKGVDLPSLAIARWCSDLALGASLALWWAAGFTAAATAQGLSASTPFYAGLVLWLLGCFAIVGTLLLVLGASGHPRATDWAIVILLVTAFSPLLAKVLPHAPMRVLEAVRPPFFALTTARQAIAASIHWPTFLAAMLHIGTWMFAMVALTTLLIGRRIPRAEDAHPRG
jgi:hypothetical protein